jgi:hypothetical protein
VRRSPCIVGYAQLLFCVAFFLSPCFAVARDQPPTLTLQAKLFYSKSANFSTDMLAPGGPELGNVVIRDDPSTSSFVIVAIAVADNQELPFNARVRLVAREVTKAPGRSRVVLDRTMTLVGGRKGGSTHVGFWLPDVGCRPVALVATLSAAKLPKPVSTEAMLPFVCNE